MASTNQSPFYKQAEVKFLTAQNDDDKIMYLEEMIRECPKHKSSEKMLANLTTRLIKLKSKIDRIKKSGKSTQEGIKKAEAQATIMGFENTGKSSLFQTLTNKKTAISEFPFATTQSTPGTALFERAKIQIIDTPSLPNSDFGMMHSADTLLIVIDNIKQLSEVEKFAEKLRGEKIIVFNKSDKLSEVELRKTSATLNSKKQNFVFFSSKTKQGIEELKQKLWDSFPVIRVYTKEPKRPATKEPMLLKKQSTAEDVAEKILKGMSKKVKRAKIWGPSAKFQGQIIGLNHVLKDKDTIEFQTK
jgi:uncharacterized protein